MKILDRVSRAVAGVAIVGLAASVHAQVKISQVFGGGGVAGSTVMQDFVELRNSGAAPVDIAGWSIQYAHATSSVWQAITLPAATIPPGGYFLLGLASGGGGTVALPTPDALAAPNLAPSGGKVALVRSTTPLLGSGCPINIGVVEDFVGYGGADCREGSTNAPPGDGTFAIVRRDGGCTDSNQNGLDFETAIPLPRNSAYAAAPCGETPTGACCTTGPMCTVSTASNCGMSGGHYVGNGVACTPIPCVNRQVALGDVALGLGVSDPKETARQVRWSARSTGWNDIGWIESVEFDNANGLSHNARGNLLALTFPRLGASVLYQLPTDGSAWRTALWEFFPDRVTGLSVSPNNQRVAVCSYGQFPIITFFEYAAGPNPGSGLGASATPWLTAFLPYSTRGTYGSAWLNNQTLLVAQHSGAVTELLAVDSNSGSVLTLTPLSPFDDFGNSQSADVEFNPQLSPYVYVLYSLFAGNSQTLLSVVDPQTWTVLKTISLKSSLETGREIALGPDRRLYIAEFGGVGSIRLIDTLALDLDGDSDIDAADTAALTDNSSIDHYREKIAEHKALNSRWTGIDVAVTSPDPAPVDSPGSCCVAMPGGCISLVMDNTTCLGFGGVFNGPGSTCGACPAASGACCNAGGACLVTFEVPCENGGGLYFGDGSTCAPTACPGPGACCSTTGACSVQLAADCYATGRLFRSVGSSCTPAPCIAELPTLITHYDFDGQVAGVGRNTSFTVTPQLPGGLYTNPVGAAYHKFATEKDVFGVIVPDAAFVLADNTLTNHPQDVFGLQFGTLGQGQCFAAADMENRVLNEAGVPTLAGGTGDGYGSATWMFNVTGFSQFAVSIDFASLGLFDAPTPGGVPDRFVISYQLDGQPATPAPLFVGEPADPARPYFCVMARGTKALYELGPDMLGPLAVNGIEVRNIPTRIMAPVPACGPASTLTLHLETSTDGERKVIAFDNIRILGGQCTPQIGSCCSGPQCSVTPAQACTATFTLGGTCDIVSTTCCRADFNRSGVLSVQDLFDFFAAYFGTSPSGDFNQSGTISVQDIFDYLAAYFAGCP